jgi:hypothetical protein
MSPIALGTHLFSEVATTPEGVSVPPVSRPWRQLARYLPSIIICDRIVLSVSLSLTADLWIKG